MFVEGGWTPPEEPPPRKPGLSERQERVIVWIIAANAVLWLLAPIGGATLFQAVAAILRLS